MRISLPSCMTWGWLRQQRLYCFSSATYDVQIRLTSILTSSFFKAAEVWNFPRHVSIMWPPAHKAITIYLSDACASYWRLTVFYGALPLRYRGLFWLLCLASLSIWRAASVKLPKNWIPAIRFDRMSRGLSATRVSSPPCRLVPPVGIDPTPAF